MTQTITLLLLVVLIGLQLIINHYQARINRDVNSSLKNLTEAVQAHTTAIQAHTAILNSMQGRGE